MIIDADINTTNHLVALKRDGVTDLGRYIAYAETSEEKVIKTAEAKAIAAAGMKLFLIYESRAKESTRGAAAGQRDGAFALAYAKTVLGAPKGAAIYVTVDFDAMPSEIDAVIAYFKAFKTALGGYYQLGAYASGYVCQELYSRGIINYRWLTMSTGFRDSRTAILHGLYELRQEINRKVAGIDVDPDILRIDNADFGAFVPFAAIPIATQDANDGVTKPIVSVSGKPAESPSFLYKLLSWLATILN